MTRRASHPCPELSEPQSTNNNPSIVISSGTRSQPHDAEWTETIEQTMASPVRHQKITRTFLLLCQQIPSFKET